MNDIEAIQLAREQEVAQRDEVIAALEEQLAELQVQNETGGVELERLQSELATAHRNVDYWQDQAVELAKWKKASERAVRDHALAGHLIAQEERRTAEIIALRERLRGPRLPTKL